MAQIIETKVYEYDELNEAAQEKAREWWLSVYDNSDAFDNIREDSARIGLDIQFLSDHRANAGSFTISAIECSEKIFQEHGADCATYKTAKAFDEANDALPELPSEDHPEYWKIENELCAKSDENEEEFLRALLEDYRVMFNKEEEYQTSDENAVETIRANEYTFTADGKRFG